ncbi:MAG TPA: hypothetical protein VFW65_13480 [Pseudonocardiaceae bacterium]|nr:hypothetical protein [Pseudonocardiaceae bacterium]
MTDQTSVVTRPPDPGPGAGHPATEASGLYHHAFWFTLLLATALVLGGGSIAAGAYTADAEPGTVVLAYFTALQRGDAAGALGYGSLPIGSTTLLTPAILAAQNAAGPIQDVRVENVQRGGDSAQVEVAYTVGIAAGPVTVDDTVPVVRDGHGWRLAHSAVSQYVSAGDGSDLARFAGFAVPDGELPMFPGAVPVTYLTPNLTLAPGSRVASFDDGGLIAVDATVSAVGRTAIAAAVGTALRACLAGRSATQHLCPAPNPRLAVPGSLRGRLTGPVQRALRFQVSGTAGLIGVTGNVPVAASYRQLDANDVASTRTTTAVPVAANAYVTRPDTIWWGAA